MTPIGHIAITSLARNNPMASLIWGCVSHWLLDETCNEYKLESLTAKHLIPYVLWQGIISIALLWYVGWWAILGLLPDIIEGIYIAIKGIDVWQTGDLLFWFHQYRGYRKVWSRGFTVLMEFIFIGVATYVYSSK